MVNRNISDKRSNGTCGIIVGRLQLGNYIELVYVRKECSLDAFISGSTSNTFCEIGLITLRFHNNVIGNLKFYSYGNGDLVIVIRAGKYCSNIFITLEMMFKSNCGPSVYCDC